MSQIAEPHSQNSAPLLVTHAAPVDRDDDLDTRPAVDGGLAFSIWLQAGMGVAGVNAAGLSTMLAGYGLRVGRPTIAAWLRGDTLPTLAQSEALLDALGVYGEARDQWRASHRAASMSDLHEAHGLVVIGADLHPRYAGLSHERLAARVSMDVMELEGDDLEAVAAFMTARRLGRAGGAR